MRRATVLAVIALLAILAGGVLLLTHDSGGPEVAAIEGPSPANCFLGEGDPKEVRFAVDKHKLVGALMGKGDIGIVLAHEAVPGADMCQWHYYAKRLAAQGYRVLPFNFDVDPVPVRDDDSVVAAAGALRKLGARKVVLLGSSRGGAAVLAAAGEVQVDGVIALSPPASYTDSDALAGASKSTAPLLIAVGALDEPFASDAAGLESVAKAAEKKLIFVKETNAHGVQLIADGNVVDAAVLSFLKRL